MGSWIALNHLNSLKNKLRSYWYWFRSRIPYKINVEQIYKIKSELLYKGKTVIKSGNYEYPITFQLIKDGRKNKILNRKINSKIKVTMIHGKKMR